MKIGTTRLGIKVKRIAGLPASAMAFAFITLFLSANNLVALQTLDADAAQRAGLTVLWQSQIQTDGSRNGLSDIHLHVHDDRASSYYEIRYNSVREVISFDDLNPRGIAFRDVYKNRTGVEGEEDDPGRGAREWAELRKEVLEAEGKKDIKIQLITVPQTTIFALTDSGVIHAFDAETGQTRWKTRIGKALEPTIGLAANNTRLVAVRGSRVYCLDSMTGYEIWSRYSKYAPGGGVAISEGFAYVTSIDGRLQMFPLNENGLPEQFFASSGASTYDPAVTANTVSWSTSRGYFNVARADVAALQYRMNTGEEFQAAGAAVGKYLIANTTSGTVYALIEDQGHVAWEFAVGERLDKTPVALGKNNVLLITANNNLVALDVNTGNITEGWPKRVGGITEYVGTSQNILYFLNETGRLVGLRRDSGARVSTTPLSDGIIVIPNSVTDRLYLAKESGSIICLRELANQNPVMHGDDFVVGNSAGEMKKEAEKASGNPFETGESTDETMDESTGESDDPFASDDPFNSDDDKDDKKEEEEDDDDPFKNG